MKTVDLIQSLAAQAAPVRPLRPPSVRLLLWFALAVPAVTIVVLSMGVRGDLSIRLAEPMFLTRLFASLATAAFAALAGLILGIPGRSRAWAAAPLLPLALWLGSLGQQCLLELRGEAETELLVMPHLHCLPDITVMMALPTVAMVLMILRGAGFHQRLELALGGLAAAALSNTALSLAHPDDAGVLVLLLQMVVVAALALGMGQGGARRDVALTAPK
jgi:hypothetical protein